MAEFKLSKTGFEKCEFEPDEDPCKNCGETHKQLYFRRTSYFNVEGEYYCLDCVKEEWKENQEFWNGYKQLFK